MTEETKDSKKKEDPKVKEVKNMVHKIKDGIKNVLCAQVVSTGLLAAGLVILVDGILGGNTTEMIVGGSFVALSLGAVYLGGKTINDGVNNAIIQAEKLVDA
jgi:hypothetical protein